MFLKNDLFFSITKNEHLNVRVNLDLGMRKDVSGLTHMLLVARGSFLFVLKNLINMLVIFHCNVLMWAGDMLLVALADQ